MLLFNMHKHTRCHNVLNMRRTAEHREKIKLNINLLMIIMYIYNFIVNEPQMPFKSLCLSGFLRVV